MNRLLLFSAVLCSVASASDQNSDFERAVTWFDTLGHPDLTELPFVRVSTGRWSQSAGKPPQNSFVNGFLLSEDQKEFSVFGLDLSTATYQKTSGEIEEHLVVDFEDADLMNFAKDQLKSYRTGNRSSFGPWGTKVSAGVQLFVLGRACLHNEYKDQANQLFEAAKVKLRARNQSTSNELLSLLKSSLSLTEMWQLIEDFGVPDISRRELLSRLDAYVQRYPGSKYTKRASDTAEILRQMVAEDTRYENDSSRLPFDQMTKDDQISDLIYRLRDQNGHQWSQPGACDIFNDQAGDDSPAALLLARQLESVPALIEILEDKRFTRSVGFHRDFYFSHHVLRYGDCAHTIISRIAGRTFYQRQHTNGAMLKDGQAETTRAQIEQWWVDVQKKGHRQVLIEGVSAGNVHSCSQAGMLVDRYPDAAFAAIRAGIESSETEFIRTQLTHELGRLNNDDATKLLTIQLYKGVDLESRVAAATELNKRGEPRAVKAMIDEFTEVVAGSDQAGKGRLLYFLAQAESPKGIEVVARNFQKLTVEHRYEFLSNLRIDRLTSGKSSSAMKQSVEALLTAALDDKTQRKGLSAFQFGQSYNDPRICDYAALVLAATFDRYSFQIETSESERDRQVENIRQQFRSRGGGSTPATP